MSQKICVKCNILKEDNEFRICRLFKETDKGQYKRSECIECEKKASKQLNKIKKTATTKSNNCDCCKKETKILVLDHDHSSGLFRGWICRNCNQGIGKLGDNIESLENAIKYLKLTLDKI
jgi:hypothetical protein